MNIFKTIGILISPSTRMIVKALGTIEDVVDVVSISTHEMRKDALADASITEDELNAKFESRLGDLEKPSQQKIRLDYLDLHQHLPHDHSLW